VRTAVVIPVKSFTMAKGRLAATLTPPQRAQLAQDCARAVVRAASPLSVYVACSDPDVAQWATAQGAQVIHCDTPGLDAAVATARSVLASDGFDHIIVAHADLPLAHTFTHIARQGHVTMVTDRHSDGTNVLSFPLHSDFHTAYGPGSLDNHIQIAQSADLPWAIITDTSLELDLDTAEDLSEFEKRKKETP
jgi:2-phospho-L-lactate/phosphoenolpyruvate guanylyltransferase